MLHQNCAKCGLFRKGGPPRRADKHRGLGCKSRLQKAKTPAEMLAFPGSDTILPKKYCTLEVSFCQ